MKDTDKGPLSLKERLVKQAEKVVDASRVKETIAEASETATVQTTRLFVDAVRKGDSLGIFRFTQKMPRREAITQWFSLSWKEWEKNLCAWAKEGDKIAKEVMETYRLCAENDLLFGILKEVVSEVERPSRRVGTKEELSELLKALAKKGLSESFLKKPEGRRKIYVGDVWYVPKQGVRFATIGWQFLCMAAARVKRREQEDKELLSRIGPLLNISTIPTDPEDFGLTRVLAGELGVVAIWLKQFRWGEKEEGLLAIALESNHRGLVLKGVIADSPFPWAMTRGNYRLPALSVNRQDDGTDKVKFEGVPHMADEEYQALKKVVKLVQLRLALESRLGSQAVEPATD